MGQQTFLGRLWGSVVNVVEHDAWPFVQHLFSLIALDTVHALRPLAEEGIKEMEADLPLLFSEGPAGFLKAVERLGTALIEKAKAQAIEVGEHDILTTAQAALANAKTALAENKA